MEKNVKNNLKMEIKYRLTISLLKQFGLCISYAYGFIVFELPFISITICTHEVVGGWFKFYNIIKK